MAETMRQEKMVLIDLRRKGVSSFDFEIKKLINIIDDELYVGHRMNVKDVKMIQDDAPSFINFVVEIVDK